MNNHMIEMGRILKEEKDLFEILCSLERNKTSAILDHNGKLLEKISVDQEGILSSILKMTESSISRILKSISIYGKPESHSRISLKYWTILQLKICACWEGI
jgi:hypothetical protein